MQIQASMRLRNLWKMGRIRRSVFDILNALWRALHNFFRISKHDLRIRPIYHRVKRRIEAHICIAFVAYKVYKELERQLKEKNTGISPEQAMETAKTIYSVKVITPKQKHILSKTVLVTDEQKYLAKLFGF